MAWRQQEALRQQLAEERGAVIKDWGGRTSVATIYPSTYYVGMSSLGLQTVYRMLNAEPDVVAERAFLPQDRMPLAELGEWLLSLETQRPLREFDTLAFSIPFELDYFNVVRMLDAAGIPALSGDRDERWPLVIAGGPAVFSNPEPLAPFLDAVVIGEAEPVLSRLLPLLKEARRARRGGLLRQLATIPGVYVPSLVSFCYGDDGSVERMEADPPATLPVHRQTAPDVRAFSTASTFVCPATEFGDLHLVEVGRGCRWHCKFCLATTAFASVRERSAAHLLRDCEPALAEGRRIGLIAAAISDYAEMDELSAELRRRGGRVSVSSVRVQPLPQSLLDLLAASDTRSITFGVEAGSERLRRVLAKGVRDEHVYDAVERAVRTGLRAVKLYLMIGLPTETDDDVDAICRLTLAIKSNFRLWGAPGTHLTVNVSPFVPKAHTPWEREAMLPMEALEERAHRIKRTLRPRGVEVHVETPRSARSEAVLARGDRRLARAIREAAATDRPVQRFLQLLPECSIEAGFYLRRRIPQTELLPWDVVSFEPPTRRGPSATRRETGKLAIVGPKGA